MKPGFSLEKVVAEARRKTRVPGIAAGLLVDRELQVAADGALVRGGSEPVREDTPFRIASVTKPFTAALCAAEGALDEPVRALLSHTAGLRCESAEPLPPGAEGLWSYSNAGYWAAAAKVCGDHFDDAMHERVLGPLGLTSTGFDEPDLPARGHTMDGRTLPGGDYPRKRRPSGGLWSTVADLLRFASHHLAGGPLFEPHGEAFGVSYGLGWWVRDLEGGRRAHDHEGSIAGYQSLLLLVPAERLALAILTNSSRGSAAVRRIVDALGLRGAPVNGEPSVDPEGRYALEGTEAEVHRTRERLRLTARERDPVSGTDLGFAVDAVPLGGDVYGYGGSTLMSHRVDFPRAGFARVGWVVLPRVTP